MVCRDLHAAIHYDGLHIITIMILGLCLTVYVSTEHDSVRCGDVTR
jgi:hypothetical protein